MMLQFLRLSVIVGLLEAATRNEREDKLSWVDKWEYFSCGRGGRHFCSGRAAGSSTGLSHTFHTLSADMRMPRSATFTRGRK
jgi:hypothetical protein